MKFRLILIILLAVITLASCDDSKSKRPKRQHHKRSLLTPASSGNPYEVLVVADDSLWSGYAGLALRDVLNKPIPMLPQEESTFHVSHVVSKRYDRITNIFRNIIVIEVSPYTTKPKFQLERNVYSDPQLIMTIKGPNQKVISSFITEHTSQIIKCFTAEELNRNAILLTEDYNVDVYDKVKEMFDCELFVPKDISKIKVGDNFIWASNDGLATIQNICIYSYPYATERVFQRGVYIALRDSFMKTNIPGGHPGQYMTTNHEFVKVSNIDVAGAYCQEARGLWEMKGDAMGGPFVSHSRVDTVNNRVVVVEGFVYAPDKMKRSMIRRLESALYTLNLP